MPKSSTVRDIHPWDTVTDAAVKILWTRFNDMWELKDEVISGTDVEAVHDMRVASRRLRVAMQTFRPCFPARSFKRHYQCIRLVAELLGEVRDRDVLIDELCSGEDTLPPAQRDAVHAYVNELKAERDEERTELRDLLKQLRTKAYDREFLKYLGRQSA